MREFPEAVLSDSIVWAVTAGTYSTEHTSGRRMADTTQGFFLSVELIRQ
jgi:hypothetical protein